MSLAELMEFLQRQRTGPLVPMSAGGVPMGFGQPRSLADILNAQRVPNTSGANFPPQVPPHYIGVRG